MIDLTRESLAAALLQPLLDNWPVYDPSQPNGYRGGPFDMAAPQFARVLAEAVLPSPAPELQQEPTDDPEATARASVERVIQTLGQVIEPRQPAYLSENVQSLICAGKFDRAAGIIIASLSEFLYPRRAAQPVPDLDVELLADRLNDLLEHYGVAILRPEALGYARALAATLQEARESGGEP